MAFKVAGEVSPILQKGKNGCWWASAAMVINYHKGNEEIKADTPPPEGPLRESWIADRTIGLEFVRDEIPRTLPLARVNLFLNGRFPYEKELRERDHAVFSTLGLFGRHTSQLADDLKGALQEYGPLFAPMRLRAIVGNGDHCVVITGVTDDKQFIAIDPLAGKEVSWPLGLLHDIRVGTLGMRPSLLAGLIGGEFLYYNRSYKG